MIIDFLVFRVAIVCFWNLFNLNGNKVFRVSFWLFWVEYDIKIYFFDFIKVMLYNFFFFLFLIRKRYRFYIFILIVFFKGLRFEWINIILEKLIFF